MGFETQQKTRQSGGTASQQFTRESGFGVDVAQELLGLPGNLNIDDRFQFDTFFDPITGQQFTSQGDVVRRLGDITARPLQGFRSDVDAFAANADRLAALSEAGLFSEDQLADFTSGLLDFGEGGLIPRTIAAAFEPFERRGREAIIAEGTRRGLLTTAGGRSTDIDRAFGEFQSDLTARQAAAVPSFLNQFLNVPITQTRLARESANIRGLPLPFQQALTGAEIDAGLIPFTFQERSIARDLERLGLARNLAGLERAGTGTSTGLTQIQEPFPFSGRELTALGLNTGASFLGSQFGLGGLNSLGGGGGGLGSFGGGGLGSGGVGSSGISSALGGGGAAGGIGSLGSTGGAFGGTGLGSGIGGIGGVGGLGSLGSSGAGLGPAGFGGVPGTALPAGVAGGGLTAGALASALPAGTSLASLGPAGFGGVVGSSLPSGVAGAAGGASIGLGSAAAIAAPLVLAAAIPATIGPGGMFDSQATDVTIPQSAAQRFGENLNRTFLDTVQALEAAGVSPPGLAQGIPLNESFASFGGPVNAQLQELFDAQGNFVGTDEQVNDIFRRGLINELFASGIVPVALLNFDFVNGSPEDLQAAIRADGRAAQVNPVTGELIQVFG